MDYLHIPYKGGVLALQDVMAGQIPSSFNVASEAVAQIGSPKLRTLAVTSKQRMPQFPQVPTFAEQGMDALTASEWMGLLAPKGTSKEVIAALSQNIDKVMQMPDVLAKLKQYDYIPVKTTPEEFAQQIQAESDRWKKVVKDTGFKIE